MIRYLILDVDGTLTDGGIYYDNQGNEFKKFCTKDGTGLVIGRASGIKMVVVTGRECEATKRRLEELHIDYIYQGVKNKFEFLKSWIEDNKISRNEMGYIGDDVNDLASMQLCLFTACPSDACEDVKCISSYISPISGGHGAVRDVIEHYLRERCLWDEMIKKCYGDIGV